MIPITKICTDSLLNKVQCNRLLPGMTLNICSDLFLRQFSTTPQCMWVVKLTRMRVVDNSQIGKKAMLEGKPPKIIHVYNKTGVGTIGDLVLMAILGQKVKGYVVGVKYHQSHMVPRMDTNNVVLIGDNGSPLGTRIHVPIPSLLRGRRELTKLLSIATRFV